MMCFFTFVHNGTSYFTIEIDNVFYGLRIGKQIENIAGLAAPCFGSTTETVNVI